MKKLNITKERFEKSRYFQKKYGKLEYVSESGNLYKTNLGTVLKFAIESSVGKNERETAQSIFDALNNHYGDLPGMIVYSDGRIQYNGQFYRDAKQPKKVNIKSILKDTDRSNQYGGHMYESVDDDDEYGDGTEPESPKNLQFKLQDFKVNCLGYGGTERNSWMVVEFGDIGYAGDILVMYGGTGSTQKQKMSVIEVKSGSIGRRIFNPTFKLNKSKNGKYYLVQTGRYASMFGNSDEKGSSDEDRAWSGLMKDINDAISSDDCQEMIEKHLYDKTSGSILNHFQLDVDFDYFVGQYSDKNPLAQIDYLAMDDTFYQLRQNPTLKLVGKGNNDRLRKRLPDDVRGVFNAAYLDIRFRQGKKPGDIRIVGQVNFGRNGKLMIGDPDLYASFGDD